MDMEEKSFKDVSELRKYSKTLIKENVDINLANKSVICIDGQKYIDSGGGFLLQERESIGQGKAIGTEVSSLIEYEEVICLDCCKEFVTSYLYEAFCHKICDACRDPLEKHCLITRTEAKNEFLLKDCDLDKRQPPLRYLLRKNPHNIKWGQMKLYLLLQVEERALEVWASWDKLKEAHESRAEKRIKLKTKQYNKKLKSLRMAVRSSLYNRTSGPSHTHEFGEEVQSDETGEFKKECSTCGFVQTYEKL